MKRILIVIIIGTLLLSLSACAAIPGSSSSSVSPDVPSPVVPSEEVTDISPSESPLVSIESSQEASPSIDDPAKTLACFRVL